MLKVVKVDCNVRESGPPQTPNEMVCSEAYIRRL